MGREMAHETTVAHQPPQTAPVRCSTVSRRTQSEPSWVTAGCCSARWTGLSAAHCSACHETFTSVSAFDLHRRKAVCLSPTLTPADIGMVTAARDWSGWSLPTP